MDIKILVAIHKNHWVPSDEMYLPIFAGKAISDAKLKYQGDDSGDNISALNNIYSELTALYWAWKNLQADAIGLVHYRRYLGEPGIIGGSAGRHPEKQILTKKTAEQILSRVDAIVPHKRNYVIETIYSHYDHTHDGNHLKLTREIIAKRCPEYVETFDDVLQRTEAHMFNMFVMKQDLFCSYCEWLFPILKELDGKVDSTGMTDFERRFPGRVGELLFDVWIEQNHVPYEEVPMVQLGRKHWFRKVRSFLAAKFRNKKYEESI